MTRRSGSRRSARSQATGMNTSLRTLIAAPGALAFYDAAYGATYDGSGNVSDLTPRIGSDVPVAAGGNRPVRGTTSPTGRVGFTFTAASSQALLKTSSTLAAAVDVSQGYSSLYVARPAAAAATRALWSAGHSSTTDTIYEGLTSTNVDRRRRFATAATQNDLTTVTTAIHTHTTVYTGAAYSTWIDGVASLVAVANVRAPVCDGFAIGGLYSAGAIAGFYGGEWWALIISTSQWTAGERQALEAAAKAYWGTP